MPLSVNDKLGPYEILVAIGEGGMGEVWKARDTRLDRIVALKVSKAQFSERFEREARSIAALNHPHICQLYDVGPNYLVMEFVEGSPLKGPLPLEQALRFAAQILDALDAAHRKGITHRDLKPANILVTKAGIKLLDFGLAKLGSSGIGQASKPPEAATLPMILTGRRAFEGSSPASVIAAIMERPAPSIVDVAPPALDRVLRKCLAKDPDNRWQSARDLKDELEWIAESSGGANTVITAGAA